MPPDLHPYLIVASSGRQLAQSAARGGYDTVVIDWFADSDTCAAAGAVRRAAADALRFDCDALLGAADELAPAGACAGLVYGSGLEDAPRLLARLAARRRLFGNDADALAAIKDPARFFPLLDRLGIPHPAVRRQRPVATEGWIAKAVGGAGGGHIRPAAACAAAGPDVYFQAIESGPSLSALFLADGGRAFLVGCSEQLPAPAHTGLPYLFGGLIGAVELPPQVTISLQASLDALVASYGLVGLNGLDFLLRGDQCSVLELNPRPTAAVDCYDADFPSGLFHWHVRACCGELPDFSYSPRAVRGHAVVYAGQPGTTRHAVAFPAWCRDLPRPGTRYAAGDPICTVHAAGRDAERVRHLLALRRAALEHALAPKPSTPFTAAGRSMLPSPGGRRDGDEGFPSPAAAGEGSLERAARGNGLEGSVVRAGGAEMDALTPNPSPAEAGEGSFVCACGAEMEWGAA